MESKEKTEKTIEMRTEQLEAQVNFLIDKQEKIGKRIKKTEDMFFALKSKKY